MIIPKNTITYYARNGIPRLEIPRLLLNGHSNMQECFELPDDFFFRLKKMRGRKKNPYRHLSTLDEVGGFLFLSRIGFYCFSQHIISDYMYAIETEGLYREGNPQTQGEFIRHMKEFYDDVETNTLEYWDNNSQRVLNRVPGSL